MATATHRALGWDHHVWCSTAAVMVLHLLLTDELHSLELYVD